MYISIEIWIQNGKKTVIWKKKTFSIHTSYTHRVKYLACFIEL